MDARLGDSLNYKPAGAGAFIPLKGHFYFDDAAAGVGSRDTAKGSVRLKIIKTALVAEPSMDDRITAPLLGPGTFRPLGPKTDPLAPTYWLVDIQKV